MDSLNLEDLHTVITKTYQNIFDIAPVLKELSAAARTYHKALQNVSSSASAFHQALLKISKMASCSKGPALSLGDTIQDIMDTHKNIENRRQEITKLMMNDLIVPIESLVESDNVYVKAILKNYNHDNKTKVELVEKARTDLLKVRKKSQRKKPTEKYEEKEKQCDEYHNNLQKQLENFRKECYQRSLSEEWKRYVFVVDRSSIFMKSFMDFNDHNAAMLREKLSNWFAQVKKKPGYQENEVNGSLIAQEIDPLGPMTSKVKIMAVFDHNATEDSQLSFKQGDVIDPISEVVSGWQYGQNVKTSKSGWYPAAYTQEIVAVPTGSSVSHTMPASSIHSRPPLDQNSGHKQLKRYSSAGPSTMSIPIPDYGPEQQEETMAPLTPPATPSKGEPSVTTTTTTRADSRPPRPSSGTLPPPPPPPPLTPPLETGNNNDSEISNPFTGVALKKTVTNDRSAPKIP